MKTRFLLAALLVLAALPAGGEELWGRRIESLAFRGDAPVEEASFARLTDLGPGQVLTKSAVHSSLRNLFATGRFADLAVEAAPSPDGAVVTIVFAAAARVAEVEVAGERIPVKGRVLDALKTRPRDRWTEERGRTATRAALRVLEERGYFEAEVTPWVSPGPDDTSVNVRFEVVAGRPAAPAPAEFAGDLGPLTADELRRKGKLRKERTFREAVAREDAERYAALYHSLGRSRAEVRYEGVSYEKGSGLATARYAVFAGPDVVLDVTGIAEAEVRRHPSSPWAKGDPPDADALERLRTALREGLQRKGYARAEVDVDVEVSSDREEVRLHAERGERWVVGRTVVEGTCAVPERSLLAVLRTRPRGIFETGRLVDSDLAADRASLLAVYRARGFPDAKVTAEVLGGALPYELDVRFHVDEGPAAWLGRVSIEGLATIDTATVSRRLRVRHGGPYLQEDVDADLASLRSALGDGGFPDGRVEARASRRPAEPGAPIVVDVVYEVSEGPRAVFGKTILRGARATRLSVLERELAYEEGTPFSMARLIRTQQNLDRLGVFSRVDVSGLSPEPGGPARSILVQVEEAKPWSLLYGLGVEYDERAEKAFNPRLSLALTHANLFGRAIAGVVEARSSRRDTRVLVRLADRSVFDSGLAGTITGYVAEEIRQSYSVRRGGAFFEASRVFAGTVKGALRYQYEIVEPDAPDDSILSEIERQDQRIFINSIGASAVVDRRDDPIVPTKGFFAAAEGKWAFPAASADAHFLKGSTQLSLYRPFRGGTLAAGVRAGLTESLVTCNPEANPGCLPNLDTPIVERVFAGGRTTHRSFPLDDLGVPGQTLKDGRGIGGNAFLLANLEWRVPLTGGLGVVLFADWGNVWAGPAYVRLPEGRWGAGLGIHYLTPVGPFRLEYGFRLDRKKDEDTGALSFSIGYPF
ncbi:MAG TPA: POTRA domain-containing protein [Thermoanaerobaculia bacterium]|nr:POTRA domain-containing protein [Thermoanaerobaculia bacterium]HQN08127.1 POTRA domain-containing protein [Thermoanaerobaculia bacterium]HQP86217.1 POTRA domain-containing protein [Thermoanaerobaculia bacterium]